MDTSILHSRIKEYKEKAKNPMSQEMIRLFESWLIPVEKYISDVELTNFQLDYEIDKLKETINLLYEILIITGNADKLAILEMNDKYTRDAILLLLKNKDRVNHHSLSAISALLYINRDQTFENLKQLKEHATGDQK